MTNHHIRAAYFANEGSHKQEAKRLPLVFLSYTNSIYFGGVDLASQFFCEGNFPYNNKGIGKPKNNESKNLFPQS